MNQVFRCIDNNNKHNSRAIARAVVKRLIAWPAGVATFAVLSVFCLSNAVARPVASDPPIILAAFTIKEMPAPNSPPPKPPVCKDCGTVEGVREIVEKGEGTGVGAVSGGVLGGVLGHQVGSGKSRTVIAIAGAIGGAVAGHEIEKSARTSTRYEIDVLLDNGETETIDAMEKPAWKKGDRVKVTDGELSRLK